MIIYDCDTDKLTSRQSYAFNKLNVHSPVIAANFINHCIKQNQFHNKYDDYDGDLEYLHNVSSAVLAKCGFRHP